MPDSTTDEAWPPLPYAEWKDTCRTLHLWSQVVGKVRLTQTPWLNHSWQVPLYVSPRGLTTGLIPHGARALELEFDFIDETLRITTDGPVMEIPLAPIPRGPRAARLRRGGRPTLLPRAAAGRPGPEGIPHQLHRQG
jgi:hypothetical protein